MAKTTLILSRTVRVEQGAVVELELPDAVIEAINSPKHEIQQAGWVLAEMYFERANPKVVWAELVHKAGAITFALPPVEDSAFALRVNNAFADLLHDGDNHEADENPFFSRSNDDDCTEGNC